MRRLPWHVTIHADRKAVLTAIGISLGACFAFLGLAVPHALDALSEDRGIAVGAEMSLITHTAGRNFEIPKRLLQADATHILLFDTFTSTGEAVRMGAIVGAEAPDLPDGRARLVSDTRPWPAELTFQNTTGEPVSILLGDPLESRIVPRGTLLVPLSTLEHIEGAPLAGRASYVLTPPLNPQERSNLVAQGLEVTSTPAITSFFRASGTEVSRDLALIVSFSSILVIVFSYEFLRSDVRDRRREIGLWRGIGLRRRDVVALLVGRATSIAIAGTMLGLVVALVLLAVGGNVTNIAVIRAEIDPLDTLVVSAALVTAGAMGGLVPAVAAARASVRDALEAAP